MGTEDNTQNVHEGESRIDLLLRAMERRVVEVGTLLIQEGEQGDEMYAVESGSMEVSIKNKFIRNLGPGNIVGELALLYSAPRSATVRCTSQCVLWSLHRHLFKHVQALASSASLLQRSTWLHNCPLLSKLDPMDLPRLTSVLGQRTFEAGQVLVQEGAILPVVMLIERGTGVVLKQGGYPHLAGEALTASNMKKVYDGYSIVRPKQGRRKSVSAMSVTQLKEFITQTRVDFEEGKEAEEGATASTQDANRNNNSNGDSPDSASNGASSSQGKSAAGAPSEGSFTGAVDSTSSPFDDAASPRAVSMSSDSLVHDNSLSPDALERSTSSSSSFPAQIARKRRVSSAGFQGGAVAGSMSGSEEVDVIDGKVIVYEGCVFGMPILTSKMGEEGSWQWSESGNGAICPVTVIAHTQMRVSYFTLDMFERVLGPIQNVLGGAVSAKNQLAKDEEAAALLRFVDMDFEPRQVLGSGSFGVVTLEKHKQGTAYGDLFALKHLSKAGAVEGGQIRHVLDERRLLLSCSKCPFILRLYGTFQTRNTVVMVTEVLLGGDLWSLMYEGNFTNGLTLDMVRFYSAAIVGGLHHMHKKGVAYRDLKPENLMLDEKGYLRIIDLGFAKAIPFVEERPGGVNIVHPKSHTLCGTPEYLAPEFIFNSGHDHSVDLWALGVLIYEMIMGYTPFAAANPDDMTALFTNIALVKKRDLNLPLEFRMKVKESPVRDVIERLLRAEPSRRLGMYNDASSPPLHTAGGNNSPADLSNYPGAALPLGASGTSGGDGTIGILSHDFFKTLDYEALCKRSLTPSYMPRPRSSAPEDSSVRAAAFSKIKPFTGDQSTFSLF